MTAYAPRDLLAAPQPVVFTAATVAARRNAAYGAKPENTAVIAEPPADHPPSPVRRPAWRRAPGGMSARQLSATRRRQLSRSGTAASARRGRIPPCSSARTSSQNRPGTRESGCWCQAPIRRPGCKTSRTAMLPPQCRSALIALQLCEKIGRHTCPRWRAGAEDAVTD